MTRRLTPDERSAALLTLHDWTLVDGRDAIQRTMVFSDFAQAFELMKQVAEYAEVNAHHPEWFNVWNRLEITLTTHDVDGLSERDVSMARYIDTLTLGLV